jgi:hypothetical protein
MPRRRAFTAMRSDRALARSTSRSWLSSNVFLRDSTSSREAAEGRQRRRNRYHFYLAAAVVTERPSDLWLLEKSHFHVQLDIVWTIELGIGH